MTNFVDPRRHGLARGGGELEHQDTSLLNRGVHQTTQPAGSLFRAPDRVRPCRLAHGLAVLGRDVPVYPLVPADRKSRHCLRILSREGRGNARPRRCLSREGGRNTRQRQCLGREGSGATRQRQCLTTAGPQARVRRLRARSQRQGPCLCGPTSARLKDVQEDGT